MEQIPANLLPFRFLGSIHLLEIDAAYSGGAGHLPKKSANGILLHSNGY
jgi:hypothetical protein